MTLNKAKQIIRDKLLDLDLPEYKLTAKTISFSGFGYGECIFVAIHDWKPNTKWSDLKNTAIKNNFRIETKR